MRGSRQELGGRQEEEEEEETNSSFSKEPTLAISVIHSSRLSPHGLITSPWTLSLLDFALRISFYHKLCGGHTQIPTVLTLRGLNTHLMAASWVDRGKTASLIQLSAGVRCVPGATV